MREIIFRGMDVKGKWHYGNLAVLTSSPYRGVEPGYYISNSAGMPFAYQVRPETVGQYTGFKDRRNNKEIYEDDILDGKMNGSCVVFWHAQSASWCIECDHASALPLEPYPVIGNIHENSDLLK